MNARVSLTARKVKWLAPLVALVLLSGAASAADRFLIPEQMGLPFYTKGLGHTDDGAWVVTGFYRPLEWVPENVNLYALDFSMDPNSPLFVEGSRPGFVLLPTSRRRTPRRPSRDFRP